MVFGNSEKQVPKKKIQIIAQNITVPVEFFETLNNHHNRQNKRRKTERNSTDKVLILYNNVAIAFKAEMINVHMNVTRYLHYKWDMKGKKRVEIDFVRSHIVSLGYMPMLLNAMYKKFVLIPYFQGFLIIREINLPSNVFWCLNFIFFCCCCFVALVSPKWT